MPRTLKLFAAGALVFALFLPAAFAQNSDTRPSESRAPERQPFTPRPPASEYVFKTYFLSNVSQQTDANEILIALRNMLEPWVKIYLVTSESAIELSAPPDQQALAQKIISELDRPRKAYRLTFTLAESDAGKRIGVQHFSLVVVSGQRVTLKQGSKIPIITGTSGNESNSQQTQFQYLDIGMNFDATLDDTPNGLRLKSKVEQSSVADEHMSGPLASEPILRQTSLEGTSAITLGKPVTIGSADVAGTTRHIDIEVVAEPIS
jgi:type II secretory pathway component GspD/PulD (secretin)